MSPKSYIYTVTSKQTGQIIAQGRAEECAKLTGLCSDTIRNMALGEHGIYITSPRLKYTVTRAPDKNRSSYTYKRYSVYSKETDEVLARGTSRECAKALGWKDLGIFHSLMSREKTTGKTKYTFRTEAPNKNPKK